MPFLVDGVWDTSESTGTGAVTVSGTPVNGYAAFSTVPTGTTVDYAIRNRDAAEYETGRGTVASGTTLTRDSVAAMLTDDFRTQFAIKASAEYRALKAQLDAIPLEEKWQDAFLNLVTTAGKNDLLTNQFKGSSYTAAWYLGLIDNASFSAVAAGDTMSSHAGWIESTAYSDGTRKTLSFGTASSGSLAATAASFSINATATINGAFCVTNSTKGGTTGTLYSAGSFSATRTVANGDTLNVVLTVTA